MPNHLYTPRSREDHQAISDAHGGLRVFWQLTTDELRSSASKWNVRHLIAYRLLINPLEWKTLPCLNDHNESCSLCNPELTHQNLDWGIVQSLVGSNPDGITTKSDSELLSLPLGQFWVDLARAIRHDRDVEPRLHPQRDRRMVQKEGYQNSSTVIHGSSSPTIPSSSEYEFEMGLEREDIDKDEHDARRTRPEEVTIRLVISFLEHALLRCLLQHNLRDTEVRPRDDGGICKMRKRYGFWEVEHPYQALLEAKRVFKDIEFNEKENKHVPVLSNEYLAQYLGEAVITWGSNQQLLGDGIFVVAAVGTFVRFIRYEFGCNYAEYLSATTLNGQLDIISDPGKDTFVHMHGTRWFNIQSSEGRRGALCCLLALHRWFDPGLEGDSDFESDAMESIDGQSQS
ncbi:uncharacterized protein BKA55DRAFT_514584 [Fusarium redolens]|uniref:Uncharacterized protein n=1 Tax=Fusarium redolens TaxID=48865 RepID=A0A9P9K418_FUSRE|nr:uncharacterized protein BKA55DRAFT_514584 [Fusarium redolens]KAH7247243.1 hypothetical protein BKA55DRAFT_514584 [Fusarium redolens]